jgi:5-methylcytosine-specific restriction endonuclease McrA
MDGIQTKPHTDTEIKLTEPKTLVLNSSYMPTHIIDSKRAFVIVYKGNGEILENYDDLYFTTPSTTNVYQKPSVIRINRWFNVDYKKVPLTRENVHKRDNYQCVYCGIGGRDKLTIDHVYPKSKGGEDSWENLVSACFSCNSEKGDLLIEEWGREHPKPYRPHNLLLTQKRRISIPENWKKFLFF